VGYIVTPIAVDLDKVKAAIGSKDKTLLAKLKKAFADELEQIDELLEDVIDEDDGLLSAADVLGHLVLGGEYREDAGFAYGYCFDILCQHFGDTLDNDE
jgi:hypothetical protein